MSGEDAIEKVTLTQDLIATFESGIAPSKDALERAKALGIDVKVMEQTYDTPY